jgi:hypothetical protein
VPATNGYEKFRMPNPNHQVAMIKRPGIVAFVAGDRTTYSQFAACVAAVQATPGSSMFWELAGGGVVVASGPGRKHLLRPMSSGRIPTGDEC